jgi:hypothetical protein
VAAEQALRAVGPRRRARASREAHEDDVPERPPVRGRQEVRLAHGELRDRHPSARSNGTSHSINSRDPGIGAPAV